MTTNCYQQATDRHLQEHPYDLVIGILSARGNKDLRDAQRETWLRALKEHPLRDKSVNYNPSNASCVRDLCDFLLRILYRFIVGNKGCDVPPNDRLDPYACVASGLRADDIGDHAYEGPELSHMHSL